MKPVYREISVDTAEKGQNRGRSSRTVKVNLAESPLAWLHARARISDRHFAAGELLRRDYEAAGLSPCTTMRWDPAPANPKRALVRTALLSTERCVAARARFEGAIAQAGSGLSDILWRVVCAGEAVPGAEKALGWPARSGRLVLSLALDRVAQFYRIP